MEIIFLICIYIKGSFSYSFCVLAAEQRLVLAADERKREFHEEKRNEFESYAEEEHDGMWTPHVCCSWEGWVHSLSEFIQPLKYF